MKHCIKFLSEDKIVVLENCPTKDIYEAILERGDGYATYQEQPPKDCDYLWEVKKKTVRVVETATSKEVKISGNIEEAFDYLVNSEDKYPGNYTFTMFIKDNKGNSYPVIEEADHDGLLTIEFLSYVKEIIEELHAMKTPADGMEFIICHSTNDEVYEGGATPEWNYSLTYNLDEEKGRLKIEFESDSDDYDFSPELKLEIEGDLRSLLDCLSNETT